MENEKRDSFLLRGRELETVENWLAASADKQPAPTRVKSRFILEGRRIPRPLSPDEWIGFMGD